MREKQILVRATGIQKENWGLAGHFLEIIKQQLFQKAVKYKAMYDIFPNLSFVISEKCLVTNFLDTKRTWSVLLSPHIPRKNIPVLEGITHRKPKYLEMRRTYTQ